MWPLLFPKNISAEIPSRLLRSSDDDDDDDADDSDDDDSDDEKFSTVSFLSTKIFSDDEESDSDGGDFEE